MRLILVICLEGCNCCTLVDIKTFTFPKIFKLSELFHSLFFPIGQIYPGLRGPHPLAILMQWSLEKWTIGPTNTGPTSDTVRTQSGHSLKDRSLIDRPETREMANCFKKYMKNTLSGPEDQKTGLFHHKSGTTHSTYSELLLFQKKAEQTKMLVVPITIYQVLPLSQCLNNGAKFQGQMKFVNCFTLMLEIYIINANISNSTIQKLKQLWRSFLFM